MRKWNQVFGRKKNQNKSKPKRGRRPNRHNNDTKSINSGTTSDESDNILALRLGNVFQDDASYMTVDAQGLLSKHKNLPVEETFENMLDMIGDDYSVVGLGNEKVVDCDFPPLSKELSSNVSVSTIPTRNAINATGRGPLSSFVHLSLLPTHRDPYVDSSNNSDSCDSVISGLNSLSFTGRDIVISSLQAYVRMHATEYETKIAWTTRESIPVEVDGGTLILLAKEDDKSLETVDNVVRGYLIRQEYNSAIEIYEALKRDVCKRKTQSDLLNPLLLRLAILNLLAGKERKAQACCLKLLNLSDVKKPEHVEALVLAGLIQFGCNRLREAHSTWREAAYKGGSDNEYTALLWNNMACLKAQLGCIEEAKESIEHSLNLQKHVSIVASNANGSILNVSTTLSNYAVISEMRKDYASAAASLEECLLLQESILNDQNYVVRNTKQHLKRITSSESYKNSQANSSKERRCLKESIFDDSDRSPLPYPKMEMGGSVDLIRMGCLTNENSPSERIKQSFLEAFRSLQLPQMKKRPQLSNRRSRSKLPVDVDGAKIIDAELNISRIHSDVADYLAQNQINEALDLLKCCLKSHRDNYGMMHPLVASTLHNIGVVLVFADRYGAALVYFEQATFIRVSTLGSDHPEVASSLMKLGLLQVFDNNFDRALQTFTQALYILRKSFGYNHPQTVKALNNTACVHSMCGGGVAATKAIEEAIEILRSSSESISLRCVLSVLLGNYGFILSKRCLNEDAAKVFEEARKLQLSVYPPNHPVLALTTSNLAHSMFLDRECRKKRGIGFFNFVKPIQCSSFQ